MKDKYFILTNQIIVLGSNGFNVAYIGNIGIFVGNYREHFGNLRISIALWGIILTREMARLGSKNLAVLAYYDCSQNT